MVGSQKVLAQGARKLGGSKSPYNVKPMKNDKEDNKVPKHTFVRGLCGRARGVSSSFVRTGRNPCGVGDCMASSVLRKGCRVVFDLATRYSGCRCRRLEVMGLYDVGRTGYTADFRTTANTGLLENDDRGYVQRPIGKFAKGLRRLRVVPTRFSATRRARKSESSATKVCSNSDPKDGLLLAPH